MLLAAERCASSPFCICSMTWAWLFFPISSKDSPANSASHGPPRSRHDSLFMLILVSKIYFGISVGKINNLAFGVHPTDTIADHFIRGFAELRSVFVPAF